MADSLYMSFPSTTRPDPREHQRAVLGWTTAWTDGPPDDWDEIRSRLRALRQPKQGRRRMRADRVLPVVSTSVTGRSLPALVPPALETLGGPQPSRVSWRRADAVIPTACVAIAATLGRVIETLRMARWWYEHNPLLMQRVLLLVAVLLAVLISLQVL